jgi:hypothetical protein
LQLLFLNLFKKARMSAKQREIILGQSLQTAMDICEQTVQQLQWRLVQKTYGHLNCVEVPANVMMQTTPVSVQINGMELGDGRTRLTFNATRPGLAIFQSNHLEEQLHLFCDTVYQAAAFTSATPQSKSKPKEQKKETPPPKKEPTLAIVINDEKLSAETIEQLQQKYRVQLHGGNYWYDGKTGAWGFIGGPVCGLVAADLPIGGALKSDASNGNTGVFFNGRNLHMQDVMALQTILPMVIPGRYWMDAYGNFGPEGGMMVGNIWAYAQAANAPRKGILSTYDNVGGAMIGGEFFDSGR